MIWVWVWGLPNLTGLSRAFVVLSFNALSKVVVRSCAPGGMVFLLGLPWGVERGLTKLFVLGVLGVPGVPGVSGRSVTGDLRSLPGVEGNMLVIKLAMATNASRETGLDESIRQGGWWKRWNGLDR